MNYVILLICIGGALFLFQCIFFITCVRWLANSKRKRDKEYALLDAERSQLKEMQSSIKLDITEGKKLSEETLKKLKILGMEAHAEWEDVTKKIHLVLDEVDLQSSKIIESNVFQLNKQRMSIEKSLQQANYLEEKLQNTLVNGQKLLRFFDNSMPTEKILKEIQTDKYTDAKQMLFDGVEASVISKKLGLSLGEVVVLSSFV